MVPGRRFQRHMGVLPLATRARGERRSDAVPCVAAADGVVANRCRVIACMGVRRFQRRPTRASSNQLPSWLESMAGIGRCSSHGRRRSCSLRLARRRTSGAVCARSRSPEMVALQLSTGAVGEELGWRGFLLPHLRRPLGTIASWWVMGILWSLWHVAGMFFPGTPLQIAPPLLFLALVAFFGVFLAFLFEQTGGSVLPTMLAHLSFNVTLGFGGAPPSSLAFWWTMVSIFGLTALIVTLLHVKAAVEVHQPVAAIR